MANQILSTNISAQPTQPPSLVDVVNLAAQILSTNFSPPAHQSALKTPLDASAAHSVSNADISITDPNGKDSSMPTKDQDRVHQDQDVYYLPAPPSADQLSLWQDLPPEHLADPKLWLHRNIFKHLYGVSERGYFRWIELLKKHGLTRNLVARDNAKIKLYYRDDVEKATANLQAAATVEPRHGRPIKALIAAQSVSLNALDEGQHGISLQLPGATSPAATAHGATPFDQGAPAPTIQNAPAIPAMAAMPAADGSSIQHTTTSPATAGSAGPAALFPQPAPALLNVPFSQSPAAIDHLSFTVAMLQSQHQALAEKLAGIQIQLAEIASKFDALDRKQIELASKHLDLANNFSALAQPKKQRRSSAQSQDALLSNELILAAIGKLARQVNKLAAAENAGKMGKSVKKSAGDNIARKNNPLKKRLSKKNPASAAKSVKSAMGKTKPAKPTARAKKIATKKHRVTKK